jgi:hypothetical protein
MRGEFFPPRDPPRMTATPTESKKGGLPTGNQINQLQNCGVKTKPLLLPLRIGSTVAFILPFERRTDSRTNMHRPFWKDFLPRVFLFDRNASARFTDSLR